MKFKHSGAHSRGNPMAGDATDLVAAQGKLKREQIASYGSRGHGVRVFKERGHLLVRVQWRNAGGLVETRSWDNTPACIKEAKSWARAFSEAREAPAYSKPSRMTLRTLWERYVVAEFPALREKTQKNYAGQWRTWELFAGRSLEADLVTPEMLDELRRELLAKKKPNGDPAPVAISQQRQIVSTVKRVFAWGIQRELVTRERILLYRFKVAKEQRPDLVAEYSPEEYSRLVPQFNPLFRNQWRTWALVVIAGEMGPRINALLHLQWDDIDIPYDVAERAENPGQLYYGAITWRSELDKVGNVRVQPLTAAARDALLVALGFASANVRATGKGTDWVFYTPATKAELKGDGAYSVQAAWLALQGAEKRAGVEHQPRRAFHGGRRMSSGNALELTNDPVLAMQWIGDTDLKQAKKYLRKREPAMQSIAGRMTAHTGSGQQQGHEQQQKPDDSNPNAAATHQKTGTAPVEAGAVSDDTTRSYE